MTRSANAVSITGENSRMKPAHTTSSTLCSASASTNARSKSSREAKWRCSMTLGRNGVALRAFQSLHAGAVGNHDANFGLQFAAHDRIDDRLQVGARAGNQYAQFDRRMLCHRVSCSLPPSRHRSARLRACRGEARRQGKTECAGGANERRPRRRDAGGTTAIIPRPLLNVRSISAARFGRAAR